MIEPRTNLVFHIGDPKTGSSSIQKVLFEGGWRSSTNSIAYPDRLNATPMAKALFKDASPNARTRQFRAKAAWLSGQTAQFSVISAEHFTFVDPSDLRNSIVDFLPDFSESVRVIAYARPHIPRLLSSFSQRVKTRGTPLSLEAFCEQTVANGRFNFAPRFLKWQGTFGNGFTLRPMIRPLMYNQDVVPDFLYTVFGSKDFDITHRGDQNESPSLAHLACLKFIQTKMRAGNVPHPMRHAVCTSLTEKLVSKSDGSGQKLQMPRALVHDLQVAYAEDARRLDHHFFEGAPFSNALEKAEANACDDSPSLDAHDHFAAARLSQLDDFSQEIIRELRLSPEIWKKHYQDEKSRRQVAIGPVPLAARRMYALLEEVSDGFC